MSPTQNVKYMNVFLKYKYHFLLSSISRSRCLSCVYDKKQTFFSSSFELGIIKLSILLLGLTISKTTMNTCFIYKISEIFMKTTKMKNDTIKGEDAFFQNFKQLLQMTYLNVLKYVVVN